MKFSRYALVGLIDNHRTETLAQSMADHFERMGRNPLLAVFDRHDPDVCDPIPDQVLARGRIVTQAGPSMCTHHLNPVPGLSLHETA